jgi:predicted transcriptional regulator
MKEDLIYKMLFSEEKVELSSEKVELGLVEDISKLSERANKLSDSLRAANAEQQELSKRKAELEKQYNALVKAEDKASDKFMKEESKVDKLLTQIDDSLSKARRAANDLGIKVNSIDGFKELEVDRNNLSKARVGK